MWARDGRSIKGEGVLEGDKMDNNTDSHFKSIKEYERILKYQLIEKNKSIDYVTGYIFCLKEHNFLSIENALKLLKFTSTIYFKKMGWNK